MDEGGPMSNEALLLPIPEAARRLGLGRSKLYELIACGDIETVRIGRAVRVPVVALVEYVDRLRSASSAA